MNKERLLLLGVDGGGTKTSAWLGTANAHPDVGLTILAKATGGASNPRALGFDAALENISRTLTSLFQAAGLPRTAVDRACFSLAGVGRDEEKLKVSSWVRREQVALEFVVASDVECVLAAAADPLLSNPSELGGIALISGTGSIAWGRSENGRSQRCGGWGYLIGDEGSGFAIGSAGLRAACRAADGRSPHTTLLEALLTELKLPTAQDLVPWVYSSGDSRQRIASLAPIVFAHFPQDDCARGIVAAAACELAQMVASVASRLGFAAHAYQLACAGGVLVGQPAYRTLILQELDALGQGPAVTHCIEDPVQGALRIAFRHAPCGSALRSDSS